MALVKINHIFVRYWIIRTVVMAPDLDQFRSLLKQKNLKATPQRIAVHRSMLALGHASADMVVDYMTAQTDAKITVASVYNILSMLSDLGIYSRRMGSNSKMYFDVNSCRHFHIYDSTCNSYKDVVDNEFMSMVEAYVKKHRPRGYKVDSIDIQLVCHPSRKGKNNTRQ